MSVPSCRLAYMEIPKAYQELVRYLNRYYGDIPDMGLWIDGNRDKQEKLTGNDWKGEVKIK